MSTEYVILLLDSEVLKSVLKTAENAFRLLRIFDSNITHRFVRSFMHDDIGKGYILLVSKPDNSTHITYRASDYLLNPTNPKYKIITVDQLCILKMILLTNPELLYTTFQNIQNGVYD